MNKKYGVRFSAHGLGFVPEVPEYNLTFEEAEKIQKDWESYADTVGGRAEIVQQPD